MSEVFEGAAVSMMMADFAVADEVGKLQVVGGGLQVVRRDHAKGATAAFALVVSQTFPSELVNEQYAFEVVLEDTSGAPVQLGQPPAGSNSNVMRFGQTLQVEEPNFRGAGVPRHGLPPRTQVVLYFNAGLPLPAGHVLVWRTRIDGDTRPSWVLPFFVPGPPAQPVLG